MIIANNAEGATKAVLFAGERRIESDTTPPAGKGDGIRPFQLLEAALASCIAITLRMAADERRIALQSVDVTVEVDRSRDEETVFRTSIDLHGAHADAERDLLLEVARLCPVRKALSGTISFVEAKPSR
jgi:putative redox protein